MSRNMNLGAVLSLQTGPWRRGLRQAQGQTQTFGQRVGSVIGRIGPLFAAVAGAGGMATMVAGLRRASSAVDDLAKSADKLGMTTEALAGLQHAANLAGVSTNQMTMAMARANRSIGEAAIGTGRATRWFDQLGLSVAELQAQAPDQRMRTLADAMNGLATHSARAAASAAIFGDRQGDLLPLLAHGSAGLAEAAAEAERLGLATSRVDAAKVEAMNDAFTRVRAVVSGFFRETLVRIAPYIEVIAERFVSAAAEAGGFGQILGQVGTYAIRAAGMIANTWEGLSMVWHMLGVGIRRLGQGLAWLAEGGVRAGQYIGHGFTRSWDMIRAGFGLLSSFIDRGWNTLREGLGRFISFVGRQISGLLHQLAAASGRIDADMARSLQSAAFAIQRTTGQMSANAQTAAHASADKLRAAQGDMASAAAAFVAPLEVAGSQTIRELGDGFRAAAEDSAAAIRDIMGAARPSDRLEEFAATIQHQAHLRAQARADDLAARQDYDALLAEGDIDQLEQAEQRHRDHQRSLTEIWRDGLAERDRFVAQSAWGQARTVLGALESTTRGVAQENKAMFRINQAAGIANATMNTSEGVTLALAKYPGPLGIAMGAMIAAAGATQIAAIAGTSYGGGGRAPSVSGSTPAPSPVGGGIATDPDGMDRPNAPPRPARLVIDRDIAIDPIKFADAVNEAGRAGYRFDGIDLR